MKLSQESLDLLSRIINEITVNGILSEELIKELYEKEKICDEEGKAFKNHFKEHIVPNLSNKELFYVTLAILEGHQKYRPLLDVLSAPNSFARDLYYSFAKRISYSPGKYSSDKMDTLNWYVYQNKILNFTDMSHTKKRATAIAIRTRLIVPEVLADSTLTMDELVKMKTLSEEAVNLSQEEMDKIINARVLSENPPWHEDKFEENASIPNQDVRVASMRKSLINAGYDPSINPKQEEKITKTDESLKQEPLKSEKQPTQDSVDKQKPKINYAKYVDDLNEACLNYQNHFYKTINNALLNLKSIWGEDAYYKEAINKAFQVNTQLKKSNNASLAGVANAIKELEETSKYINQRLTFYKYLDLLLETIEKAKALNDLMTKSFTSPTATNEQATIRQFVAEFNSKEKTFLKSSHPEDAKHVLRIKIILAACTLGLAIIPMIIYSKIVNGSGKFWQEPSRIFVNKGKAAESLLEKEQDKTVEKPASASLARA